MNCKKCGTPMVKTELEQLTGNRLSFELECPACHYRQAISGQNLKKLI